MNCPRCGSPAVNINVINEVRPRARHGVFWWIFIGWWWRILWFLFFGMWYFLFLAIRGRKYGNVQKKVCVCQQCGNSWTIR